MVTPSYKELKRIAHVKGYRFFTKVNSINIIGIRNPKNTNTFGCTMCVAYLNSELQEVVEYFPCTTKPGKHWLLNPLNTKGTAIIVEGQYRGVYKLGFHNRSRPSGTYEALEQQKPMRYFRDNNQDSIVDCLGKIFTGIFKTNVHRAAKSGWSRFVDKWSAGCQVITGKNIREGTTNWLKFLALCKLSANLYGNSFTYTLINEHDLTN